MNLPNFNLEKLRGLLPQMAMCITLGYVLGFLFFYHAFPYFSVPSASSMPAWTLVLALIGIGLIAGYLFPDILQILTGAVMLPIMGALFCFAIFASPVLSPEITAEGLSENLLGLTLMLLSPMIMAFLVIFLAGFASLYIFESHEG